MSETVEMTDPLALSVGGRGGHLLRRVFHISMAIIPFIYYLWYETFLDMLPLDMTREEFASALVLLLIIAEAVRLKIGFTIYGQREYEAKQVSALAWGAFGIGLVCLYAPSEGIGFAIVLCLSFGDPLLGELRRRNMDEQKVLIAGTVLCALIWAGCSQFSDSHWLMVPLFAPLCVLAEKPRLRYIDDNATMTLIPLFLAMLLGPWL